MKKKNLARRALEKMGIGKRSKSTSQPATPTMMSETTASHGAYQAPHSSVTLERKMKRRHLSNFARQCADYIKQMLAKRKEARAQRQLRSL